MTVESDAARSASATRAAPTGVQNYEYSFTMEEPTGSAGIVLMLIAVAAELCVDEIWLVSGSG